LVIPETTPVMIDRVVNAAGEVLGTRLVISGLGTVICQEAYETVRSLVQKYMGVRGYMSIRMIHDKVLISRQASGEIWKPVYSRSISVTLWSGWLVLGRESMISMEVQTHHASCWRSVVIDTQKPSRTLLRMWSI